MSKVALMKCDDYKFDNLYKVIKEGLELTGGIKFVKDKKVLLKPNLLSPEKPEKAVTTHPEVVRAVIRILHEAGAKVYVGDSPGTGTQEIIYNVTGMKKVIEEEGAEFADFKNKVEVLVDGKVVKKFIFAKAVKDVDYIFSLPKLKTHAMTYYTGVIKNLFGTVPGILKPKFHYTFSEKDKFSEMLIDLNIALKPIYGIMDAVVGMEGNGPRNGDPKKIGAILISKDFIALDATACRLVNISPYDVMPIVKGFERGLGEIDKDKIEILGEKIEKLEVKDFKKVKKELKVGMLIPVPNFINKFIKNILVPKPYFDEKKCILCGECVKVCPPTPKALKIEDGKVKINRERCIRCFCCQEMCPVNAIEPRRITGNKNTFK
ncbi:DUF362 domain-containing protein [Haliovirga abyssi]|uniref:(4Fe-4S)-binding protein n=1 Tax=Haliovirga abyssi TaxID=2996794 RepID=A0AAU9D8T9_9FUSO|nr:DUF362 domain-containing protein [Haliovirga abyssi]BDU50001.1 (4Fe-4S)-binding protein [Haliovirga abyssi]